MLACRYLGSRRKESFISFISVISFIGIMLGVATLIIVMAVMNGFRTELLNRILGMNGHMVVQPAHTEMTDYEAIDTRFEILESVILALPLIEGQALVSGRQGSTGAIVRGIFEVDLKRLPALHGNINQGSLDGFDRNAGAVIGVRMAEKMGLTLGENIKLINPQGDITAFGIMPRVKYYPIVAIFEMGMSEYDSSIIFLPMNEVQWYFNKEGKTDLVEVFVENPDDTNTMRRALEVAARRPVYISDWRQKNIGIVSALEVERNVMFLILTLIILIAALNIVSGLFMLVKDKGRDIAVLRTMGMSRGSIMRVFLITGSSIGILGTFSGVCLGTFFCLNIKGIQNFVHSITEENIWDPTVRFLSEIPARLDIWETMTVVFMALGLSLLATLFPAWRAARLDPVEALRYE